MQFSTDLTELCLPNHHVAIEQLIVFFSPEAISVIYIKDWFEYKTLMATQIPPPMATSNSPT